MFPFGALCCERWGGGGVGSGKIAQLQLSPPVLEKQKPICPGLQESAEGEESLFTNKSRWTDMSEQGSLYKCL